MLVHKSVYIRPEVWRRLKVNACLSGVPVRDYLTYLIVHSEPVTEENAVGRAGLQHEVRANASLRKGHDTPFDCHACSECHRAASNSHGKR